MSIIRYNPGRSIFSLKSDMDRLFEDFFGSGTETERLADIIPATDVFENENEFIVKAEVPGMKKDDIKITFENNYLTISGEKKSGKEVKEENYHQLERSYGKFMRRIGIPSGVMLDKINAEYEDGVLSIHIPKAEEAKPKQIDIKVK